MRVRTRTPIAETKPFYLDRIEASPSAPPPNDYVVTNIFDDVCSTHWVHEEMEDMVTPKWHSLRNSGGIANNPMKSTRTETRDTLSQMYIYDSYENRVSTNPDTWETIYALYDGTNSCYARCAGKGGYLTAPSLDEAGLDAKAYVKAKANVSLNEAEGLVMLAESQKTVYSLCSIAARFIKILKKIKRLDYSALRQEVTGKELSDRYMELRYAIRPLMYDLKGVQETLQYNASERPNRLTFRGHEYERDYVEQTDTYSNGNWSPFSGVTYNRSWDSYRKTSVSYDVRAGVLTQLESLSKVPVWGFTEPIEAAWELIPFSFIVDWFFNVGDTIAAWTPNFGLRHLASWTVSTKIVEKKFIVSGAMAEIVGTSTDPSKKAGEHMNLHKPASCSETVITKTRTPEPGLAILPSRQFRLDVLKLADLLIIGKKIFFTGK